MRQVAAWLINIDSSVWLYVIGVQYFVHVVLDVISSGKQPGKKP